MKRFISISTRLAWILCFLCLTALVLSSMSGCAPREEELLRYQTGALRAEISGGLNGIEFSATLSLDEMAEGSPRAFCLTLASPESLRGVSFCRAADGTISASVGGVTCDLDDSSVDALIYLVGAFSVEGDALDVSAINGADAQVPDCDRLTRLVFEDYTIYLDSATSMPVKIEGGKYSLSVRVKMK